MKANGLSEDVRTIIKITANNFNGAKRRRYLAEITNELFDGNARKAERVFGWGRETVKKGLRELNTGIICLDNYSARGNKKTEEKLPGLVEDIRSIVNLKQQAGSLHKRGNTKTVRHYLIHSKGYREAEVPSEETIKNILNRTGVITEQTIMFDELPVRCRKYYQKWLKQEKHPESYVVLASKEPKGKNGRRIWMLSFIPVPEFEAMEKPVRNPASGDYYRVIEI